jgi:hypothetical protein
MTQTIYRQSKSNWEIRYVIPDEYRDKFTALEIGRLEAGSIGSKIPRCIALAVGVELEDEEAGHIWEVVKVRGFVQPLASRKKGRAPIAWVKLIELKK